MSAEIIVAAEGSVDERVLDRAHYIVPSASNGLAVAAASSTAASTIETALNDASPGTTVRTVGDFYFTESVVFPSEISVGLDGLGSRFLPGNDFPTGDYLLEVGQYAVNRNNPSVVNVTIDGRAGSGSGGETHFRTGSTISTTVHGINFAGAEGNMDKVRIHRLTGHAIRFGVPDGSAATNTDGIFTRIVLTANLGGGIWMAGAGASTDMHMTNVISQFGGYYTDDFETWTLVKQNVDGLWGNPTSIQMTACDFDWNTGSGYRITGGSKYSKIIGSNFRYNGTASATRGGGIYSDSAAPTSYLIEECFFLGGYGTQLYMPDFFSSLVLTGLLCDPATPDTVGGDPADGTTNTATRAINANASGRVVVATGVRALTGYSSSAFSWPASAVLGAVSSS